VDDETCADLLDAGYRYALVLCRDAEQAADLVQDAWIAVLRAGKSAPPRGYLFRAVRSRFVDALRRRPHLVETRQLDPETMPGPNPEVDSDGSVLDALGPGALDEALAELRWEEREALALMVLEGLSAGAAARVLDKPRGTVLSLVHRAKQRLRATLERRWRETAS